MEDFTTEVNVFKLNVGGIKYETTRETLIKYPDSMLGRMFSGTFPTVCDKDGHYFIDADGEMFKYILSFLRMDELLLPDKFTEFPRLEAEADFYQLIELIQELSELKEKRKEAEKHVFICGSYKDEENNNQIRIQQHFACYKGKYKQFHDKDFPVQFNSEGLTTFVYSLGWEVVVEKNNGVGKSDFVMLQMLENIPDIDERFRYYKFDELKILVIRKRQNSKK